jgi:hypothetical protein
MSRRAIGPAILLALLAVAPALGATCWEQAETEHFLFIFQPRDRQAADELLSFCEEVYAKVTGFFRSYPEKIPCVIHGGVDNANGGTSPFPARIDLTVTSMSDHTMGARSESWLRVLLTHELTHFVHFTMDRGPFYALSRVFGRDAAMAGTLFLPGWMVEGPTTNLETIFSAGGRGRNPLFEIYSKAPILEGGMFSLRQAGYDSAFPPHGRIYVAGNILIEHILSTYGEDSFTRIMDAYLAFPFFGPWRAIEKVTGRKASDVYEDMRVRLAERHRARPGIAGGALVSPDAIGDYWRPQATSAGLYVYRSTPEKPPAIVRHDPVSGGETVLLAVALTDETSYCSTADGGTVYFAALDYDWRNPGPGEVTSDLYRLETGTGEVKRVTRGAHLWQPAVSPDGRLLAAVQASGSYSRLVAVERDTGSVREVFSREESNVYNPSFSPDGARLAFTFNQRGFQDIAVAPFAAAATDDAVLLTGPDPAGEYYPRFLEDGRLLYSSDRSGVLCLYLADPSTGESSLALEDPIAAISGVQNGGTLVYSSYSSRGFCLKSVPIAELPSRLLGTGAAPPLPALSHQPYPPAFEWTGRAAPSEPYHDLPLPCLWYPWLPIGLPGPGSVDVGLGAAVLGSSLLGISSWSLGAAWHPVTGQPTASVSIATALGRLRIDAAASLDYGYASSYEQDLLASLALSLPLVSRNILGRGFAVTARTSLAFGTSLERDVPFTLSGSLAEPAGDWSPSLRLSPGIGLRWKERGSRIDFYPPWDFAAAVDLSYLLPVFPASGPPLRLLLSMFGSVPSVFAHHVIKLGARASYSPDSAGMYYDPFVAPRGAFPPVPRGGPGVLLGSIDYLVPVALLDAPLVLGLGLTGIGLGAHAEWGGEFGFLPVGFLPDTDLYVGLEVTFQLTAGIAEFPVGLGLAARIDTTGSGFDPAADLRPYIFFSFDSFRDAAEHAQGGARWFGESSR